jgi:hypothetical protein
MSSLSVYGTDNAGIAAGREAAGVVTEWRAHMYQMSQNGPSQIQTAECNPNPDTSWTSTPIYEAARTAIARRDSVRQAANISAGIARAWSHAQQ